MMDPVTQVGVDLGLPLKARTGAGEVEQVPMRDQIAAAKFLYGQNAAGLNSLGIRFRKCRMPNVNGQVIGGSGEGGDGN